jgi:HD-like signal output (HDOD) protein/CheY-like chemotaxis protein
MQEWGSDMPRILVVDDMEVIREPMAAMLREQRFETDTACNGREAIDRIAANEPDIILLDVSMPLMDGLSLLRLLPSRFPHRKFPVILLTAASERKQVVEAASLGVKEYILKTHFSAPDLLRRTRRLLAVDATLKDNGHTATGSTAAPASADARVTATTSANAPKPSPGSYIAQPGTSELPRLVDRAELLNRLSQSAALRGFSPALQQLSGLSAERQSVEEITRIVKQDPALVARLLGLANSSLYLRGGRVDTVHRAIQRIGVAQVRNTALSLQVIDGFGEELAGGRLLASAFWEHCIATGLAAYELATLAVAPPEECESAFSAGLLHDCGRMALAQTMGEAYGHVLDQARDAQLPVEFTESKMLQMTHADAAKVVLSGWGIPDSLVTPISMHQFSADQIEKHAAPVSKRMSLILALADRLAKTANLGDSGNPCLYPLRPFVSALELEPAQVESTIERVIDRTQEMKCLLLTNTPRAADTTSSAWSGPFPLLLDEASDLDEVGLFCRRVSKSAIPAERKSTVCIVNLCERPWSDSKEERLLDHDAKAGAPVPTVIITKNEYADLPLALQQRPNSHRLIGPLRTDVLREVMLRGG